MYMVNAALYIGADPLSFNDISLIKKSIKMFGFVNIILDRKNRDAEYDKYYLNYINRSDIIHHDLKQLGITQYKIIPVDETVQQIIVQNNFSVFILNLDYQKITNFRIAQNIRQFCSTDVDIIYIYTR